MKIEIKNKLSKNEVEQVFNLYLESYYKNEMLTNEELIFVKESIKSPIFTWYLLKEENFLKRENEIIGIGSFVNETIEEESVLVNDEEKQKFETNLSVHPLDINYELKENVTNIAVSTKFRGKGYSKLLINEIISNTNCDLVLEIKKNSDHFDQLVHVYKSLKFEEFIETETGVFLRRNSEL